MGYRQRKLKGDGPLLERVIADWYRRPDLRKAQRLGQYIWNTLGYERSSWAELFYETKHQKAANLARLHFRED